MELEQSRETLERNGVRVAAVSYDSQATLAAFAEKYSVRFPLLSDKGSETIRKFGIFNLNMAPDLRAYGVPHPVDYLVTPDGIVDAKYFVPNYQHRVSGSAVALREFGAVDGDAPMVRIQSGALTVELGLASARVFAGQELSFFANFALQPGWHIYGVPASLGYTAAAISFNSPNVVSQELQLPAPEMLHVAALGETLPVYTGSFQAIGTLLLKHPLPEGRLVLPGRLAFQQCSDTVCEPPEAISFELELTSEPFVVAEQVRPVR